MTDIQRVKKVVDWLIFKDKIKSRKELAEKMGYTESSMSQILNGKVSLSERFIKKLSIMDDAINQNWILTGDGNMLNCSDDLTEPIFEQQTQMYYGGGESVEIPREVFDQIAKLTETILSQQRVIESQSGIIESLVEVNKKMVAHPGDNVICADASGSGIKK